MATPKVIPFPSTAQVPPTTHTPQEITQGDLSYILATRLEIQRLKTNLTEAEESLKFRLEAGARVDSGVFRTWLKEHFRRAVAWREVAERVGKPTLWRRTRARVLRRRTQVHEADPDRKPARRLGPSPQHFKVSEALHSWR